MKKKIAEALKTKYKSFGLSNEAFDRIASAKEETVTKEEDIEAAITDYSTMDLIAKELQKMRDSEIQKRTDLQREHDDYKAKHPEKEEDKKDPPKPDKEDDKPDFMAALKAAVAEAVNPIKESFEEYKKQNSAKEAKTVAKEAFYGNKWTTKFKEEADDAWERAFELNEAKGGSMTADELSGKANEYFNRLVKRKGADVSKPFEAEEHTDEKFDFSEDAKALESAKLLEPENK